MWHRDPPRVQEMDSLKQQLGDAQRVIVEKLARAPSEQELGQLKAAVDKLKVSTEQGRGDDWNVPWLGRLGHSSEGHLDWG